MISIRDIDITNMILLKPGVSRAFLFILKTIGLADTSFSFYNTKLYFYLVSLYIGETERSF